MKQEIYDPQDHQRLVAAILMGSVDDYIKLQHPTTRKRAYLNEAFEHACGLLFDDEFRLLYVKSEDGQEYALKDLLQASLDDDRPSVQKLREYVISEAQKFWETKKVNTLYIPSSLIINGHVWTVLHTDDDSSYDTESMVIYTNKKDESSLNQESFFLTVWEILLMHYEVTVSKQNATIMGKALFQLLRQNDCFCGDE